MNIVCSPAKGSGDTDSRFCRLELNETDDPTAIFGDAGKFTSSLGGSGCHIMECDGNVYVTNYVTGSIFMLKEDGNAKLYKLKGHGKDTADRQASAHSHQIITTPTKVMQPDGTYKTFREKLCVTDLGLDALVLLDKELNEIDRAYTPAGHGPRHTVFSHCGRYAYTVNELISGITTFEFDGERLKPLDTITSLPEGFEGISYGAAIRLTNDGRHLYCSNRGHNSIAHFSVDGPKVTLLETISCDGDWPRDFNISPDEKFVVCTNERGNNVTVYSRDTETGVLTRLPQTIKMPIPLCAVFG
nr:lactonase family protein [Clostridia bacterium]